MSDERANRELFAIKRQSSRSANHSLFRVRLCLCLSLPFLALTFACFCLTATAAAPVPVPPTIRFTIDILRDPAIPLAKRRDAAAVLIKSDEPAARGELIRQFIAPSDAPAQQAIAQAIASLVDPPPASLAQPLFNLLQSADDPIQSDVAIALNRFNDPALARQISDLAASPNAPLASRRGAMRAIAEQRTRAAARQLIDLIEDANPDPVRNAAMAALLQLAGISDSPTDPAAWRTWWNDRKDLTPEQFAARLHADLTSKLAQSRADNDDLVRQLVRSQGLLYSRLTPEEQPEFLTGMLADSRELMRRGAIELFKDRLRSEGLAGITTELRDALRNRLKDSSDLVQLGALTILRDLSDDATADRVAQDLAARKNLKPELLQLSLELLSRVPRAPALPRIIDLLSDAAYSSQAAAALSAAANLSLLSPSQLTAIGGIVRNNLSADRAIDARMVTLLAHVANESDWRRIESWLDSPDRAVKDASATIWARFDKQPLAILAQHAADPVILPILLDAAVRRGSDRATLVQIAQHKPQGDNLVEPWRKAILSMAARVPAADVLAIHATPSITAESTSFQIQLLTVALRTFAPTGAPPATRPAGQTWSESEQVSAAELFLARGLLREGEDMREALADYRAIEALGLQITADQRRKLWLNLIRTLFRLDDLTDIPDLARKFVAQRDSATQTPSPSEFDALARIFVDAARAAADATQFEASARILRWLRDLSLPSIQTAMLAEIGDLENRLGQKPFTSVPASTIEPPATQPLPISTELPTTQPAPSSTEPPATQPTTDSSATPAAERAPIPELSPATQPSNPPALPATPESPDAAAPPAIAPAN